MCVFCGKIMYCWRIVNWTLCLLRWDYILLAVCELYYISCYSEVMSCWRIVSWTLCLFAVRLCTAGGLWTELCVWLQWDCVMLADFELNYVSFAVSLYIAGGLWTELCVVLRWVYVLLASCELYIVSGCSEVMYCWRIVNWTVRLVAVRLCTAGGFWTELCVFLW